METNGLVHGSGEMAPDHEALDGTDLEIACGLQDDDLTLEVVKAGVPVFRVKLRDAAAPMTEGELVECNSFAPDLMFTVGDRQEGVQRMLASAGMAELVEPQKRGFIRWLLGR